MTPKLCKIEGCEKPVKNRGWCSMHAARWARHGSPHAVTTYPEVCAIDGCNRKFYARGWCTRHYAKWKQHGVPTGGGDKFFDAEEAFAARTVTAPGGCVIWTGCIDVGGYGRMRSDGDNIPAHRHAWERSRGKVPSGKFLDHTCWNRACVNVEHLRLVTTKQNNWNRSGPAANSVTGVRNVHAKNGRYIVKVRKDGRAHYGGVFDTVEEAAPVAEKLRAELFGEYAGAGRKISQAD